MAAAFQQQIFALDARFNAYRAPNNPNFSKLYRLPTIITATTTAHVRPLSRGIGKPSIGGTSLTVLPLL